MNTIPPVEIPLLRDHATLPSRESVLALFADHYQASLERASRSEAHDDLAVELLASEPVADLEVLAGEESPFGAELGGGGFELANDPFALERELTDDGEPDVFALADSWSAGESDAFGAFDGSAEAPVEESAGFGEAIEVDALGEARERAWEPVEELEERMEPEPVDEELEADGGLEPFEAMVAAAEAAEPTDATTMMAAWTEDEEPEPEPEAAPVEEEAPKLAEPEDATTMIQAIADEDEPLGVTVSYGEEATTLVAAMADDEEQQEGGEAEGAPDLSTLPSDDVERPTRKGRRATRKTKRNK